MVYALVLEVLEDDGMRPQKRSSTLDRKRPILEWTNHCPPLRQTNGKTRLESDLRRSN